MAPPSHARADKTKGFYDLYGEEALKDGLPDNDGGKSLCF